MVHEASGAPGMANPGTVIQRAAPPPSPPVQVCVAARDTYMEGAREKQVETSASVCLRPVLPGGGSCTSCSSSGLGLAWLYADGRVQKAAGGDGAMPAHPTAAGVHGEQQEAARTHTDRKVRRRKHPHRWGPGIHTPDATAGAHTPAGAVEVIVHSTCRTDCPKVWGCVHSRAEQEKRVSRGGLLEAPVGRQTKTEAVRHRAGNDRRQHGIT